MSTVADIVKDAFLHLKVADATSPLRPHQMQQGMRALNLMMATLEADGLSMGWSPVSDPTDPLPVPPEHEEAIGYMLAVRLRPRTGVALAPDLVMLAQAGESSIRAAVTASLLLETESPDLPAAEGQCCYNGLANGLRG